MSLTGVREIDEEIIFGNNHPYYINYCYTSQDNLNICNEYVYQLYRKWCEPSKTLEEIQELLPDLTYPDLVELALVYYPIPESVGKYDRLTLFYYACETNQEDPIYYLQHGRDLVTFSSDKLLSILLAFNRTDLLPRLRDLGYIDRIMYLRYMAPSQNDPNSWKYMNISIFFDCSLFDPQILMERALTIKSRRHNEFVFDDVNDIVKGIAGIYNGSTANILAIKYINNQLDIGVIQEALDHYLPGKYVASTYEYDIYGNDSIYNYLCSYIDSKELTFGYLVFYPDELSVYETNPEDLGLYYITSGRFAEYISWKESVGDNYRKFLRSTLIKQINNNLSFGCNRWGLMSSNADLYDIISEVVEVDIPTDLQGPKSSFPVESKFPDKVDDRIYEIHPHNIRDICEPKDTLNVCTINRYNILQRWVFPYDTIPRLRKLFPKLTFKDTIDLSLIYNPIEASVGKYDIYTIFYHACERNQSNAVEYLKLYNDNSSKGAARQTRIRRGIMNFRVETIIWICCKFRSVNILTELIDLIPNYESEIKTIISLIPALDNKPVPRLDSTKYYYFDKQFHSCNMLFDDKEYISIVIAAYKLGISQLFVNLLTDDSSIRYNKFVRGRASRLNKDTIDSTLYIQGLSNFKDIIHQEHYQMTSDIADELGYGRNTISKFSKQPELIEKCIPRDYWGVYYITSGRFDLYMQWKERGHQLPHYIDNKYFGMNEFGQHSMNKELYDRLDFRYKEEQRLALRSVYLNADPSYRYSC